MTFPYPPARRDDVSEVIHGVAVADPYRWLEDPDDPATSAFIAAQNALAAEHFTGLSEIANLREPIAALWSVERTEAPATRAGTTVWPHNPGGLDQPQFFVRTTGNEVRLLLDPNELSADGAVAVLDWALSPNGEVLAYSMSEAGSDWQTIHLRDTARLADLAEVIEGVKFPGIAWTDTGFYYSGYPTADRTTIAVPDFHTVFFHELGTSQSDDVLVFRGDDPEPLHRLTPDGASGALIVEEYRGTSLANGLWFRAADAESFVRLAAPGVARHEFLYARDDGLVVFTDRDAPNGRVAVIPFDDTAALLTLVPERATPVESVTVAADSLFVVRLVEGSHVVERHELDGTPAGTLDLPGPGAIVTLSGTRTEPDVYAGFVSFSRPQSVIHWTETATTLFAGAEQVVSDLMVERHRTTSTDGVQVGMFVIRRTDTELPAPTELYGYGGFNINMVPTFNPGRLAFVEAGGVSVIANLRGGSEHGERWHEQGMLGNKQQVFDDFISCAEHLIAEGVTTPSILGIHGRSNGGLLTAATMLQRPDLFGAVLSVVPVTDMLRYQRFTAGRHWTPEFGDAAWGPEALAWLLAYSPLHNVEPGTGYPPTLITTAESDDRVVPMHALKFAATMQHAAGGASDQPILLHVETRAGHGMGKPTSKLIDEYATLYGFLLHHLQ